MGDDSVYSKGLIEEARPTPQDDQEWRGLRLNRLGELMGQPMGAWRRALAREGTYFVAHNPTNDAATTLAGHPAPLLADADATMTKPFLHLRMAANSTKIAELDYVEIEVVTAGANGTQACWACQLDTGATRVTTAGTTLTTVNPNMQSTASPDLAVQAGVVVTGAESASVRHLAHGTHRPSIEIAGDKYLFLFGENPVRVAVTAAGAVRDSVVNLPPVLLGATDQFLLAMHGQAAQDAAGVYKIRMGWFER